MQASVSRVMPSVGISWMAATKPGAPAIKTKHHMYMGASFQEILVLWSVTEGEHGKNTHHPLALEHIPVGPGWGLN